ncbi:MAG: response regulator transcription factor [Chitinophagales bacterium]|nr:response regulator transcription factor [Chitinophagales bacterium]
MLYYLKFLNTLLGIYLNFCTVYEDDENIFKALSNGASGYILKPTPPVQLIEAIYELHRGRSPMSSGIARKSGCFTSYQRNRCRLGDINRPLKTDTGTARSGFFL